MTNLIALQIGNVALETPAQMPSGGLPYIINLIGNLISMLLVIVAVVALFSLIYTGIQWTTSGGDEKKIEAAKGRLKYSIIGLIVSLTAFGVIQFIGNFFGVSTPFAGRAPRIDTCSSASRYCASRCASGDRRDSGHSCTNPAQICCSGE
jgi:hypothetical protein